MLAGRGASRSGRSRRRCCFRPRASTTSTRRSVRPWTAGAFVLCDRFADSTRAYQGVARRRRPGADRARSSGSRRRDPAGPDLDPRPAGRDRPGAGRGTAPREGEDADRFEAEAPGFHERLREPSWRSPHASPAAASSSMPSRDADARRERHLALGRRAAVRPLPTELRREAACADDDDGAATGPSCRVPASPRAAGVVRPCGGRDAPSSTAARRAGCIMLGSSAGPRDRQGYAGLSGRPLPLAAATTGATGRGPRDAAGASRLPARSRRFASQPRGPAPRPAPRRKEALQPRSRSMRCVARSPCSGPTAAERRLPDLHRRQRGRSDHRAPTRSSR